jgi:hypothetical protein
VTAGTALNLAVVDSEPDDIFIESTQQMFFQFSGQDLQIMYK